MTRILTEVMEAVRTHARREAGEALSGLGFTRRGNDWSGPVELPDGNHATLKVVLPPHFPDVTPDIFMATPPENGQIAHVDRNGKICIVPSTGTLLDSDRPQAIVTNAIELAINVLGSRSSDSQVTEIADEFSAYWEAHTEPHVLSLCDYDDPGGRIAALQTNSTEWVLASDERRVREWAQAIGAIESEVDEGFLIRLHKLPELPRRDLLTLRDLLAIVRQHGDVEQSQRLLRWLKEHGEPAIVLLMAPHRNAAQLVVFACRVPAPLPAALPTIEAGFRPGRSPPALRIARMMSAPIERPVVRRADPRFLIERAGGDPSYVGRSVIVVGCGSVGSYVAHGLASFGFGRLTLIDPEVMALENVFRHVLGAESVGTPKANALAATLKRSFPHLDVRPYAMRFEDALDRNENFVGTDVLILATGDATLERRLNRLLHAFANCLHVWVEPLGLGGHVVSSLQTQPGCYECLFRRDDRSGLVNMASFAAPGQPFQRTLAGCGGTFTPFGALDAQQMANIAVRETARMSHGSSYSPCITSWCGSKNLFTRDGFQLSERGKNAAEDSFTRFVDFAQPSCIVCKSSAL